MLKWKRYQKKAEIITFNLKTKKYKPIKTKTMPNIKTEKVKKIAVLVTYEVTVRIVIDEPSDSDEFQRNERIASRSSEDGIDKAVKALKDDDIFDHFVSVKEDVEVPFGTLNTDLSL